MTRPEAIFFDLFGTLLHFDYSILPETEYGGKPTRTTSLEVHRRLVERYGFDRPFQEFHRKVTESRDRIVAMRGDGEREFPSLRRFQLVAESLGLAEPGAAELMVEIHMEQMFQMMYLPDENRHVLERLDGIPLVLASNFDHAPTVRRALAKFEMERFFAHVFISDEVGWRKPGRNFFEAIVGASGFAPGSSVFVGDDPRCDLWGAARMGFATAWLVGDGLTEPPVEPTWRLGRLPELLEVLPHF